MKMWQISFNYNIWFTSITLALSGLVFAFFVYRLIGSLVSEKIREKLAAEVEASEATIIPRTKKEKRFWAIISFSAGTCEEIVFRGFLVFLLQAVFPDISIVVIMLATFVTFGLGHIYQGLQGVISTGILAVLFMSLFLVTGSLIFPMILHFILDLSQTFVLSEKRTL